MDCHRLYEISEAEYFDFVEDDYVDEAILAMLINQVRENVENVDLLR